MANEEKSHDILKVSDAEIAEIEKLAKEAGLSLEGEGELGGWVGGRVVLVPTDQAIKDWAPIAERRV
jgi:2',3'-cyclic-nucleotide 3'-phosphodiesterase